MNKIVQWALFSVICFVLLSCVGTTVPVFELTDNSIQDDKYNIQVQVMTQEELQKQSGRVPSPFIRDAKVLEPREYVTFAIVIKNKTDKPATFELTDLELHLGASYYYTKNANQIKNYWNDEDEIDSADKTRMGRIADKYLLPREVTIPADGLKRGYAVFFAKMPKYGEMTLFLPLMSEGFKPDIYEFTFPFTKL